MREKILNIFYQLFPTGRAWKKQVNTFFLRLNISLSYSIKTFTDKIFGINYALIPDNDNYDLNDANNHIRVLGLNISNSTPLLNKKIAILRKLGFPNKNAARSSAAYIQNEIWKQGFSNVYVFENISSGVSIAPFLWNSNQPIPEIEFNQCEFGTKDFGYYYENLLIGKLAHEDKFDYYLTDNYNCVFFLCGQDTVNMQYADVSISRKTEFEQLVLNLKQTQIIAALYINYI